MSEKTFRRTRLGSARFLRGARISGIRTSKIRIPGTRTSGIRIPAAWALTWSLIAAFALGAPAWRSAAAQQAPSIRIAAAADLEPVLPSLIAQFEKQTGIRADASYASSATLAMQIIGGGPFDLFLAADLSFPEKVIAAGLGETDKPLPYARGTLVLWARSDSALRRRGGLSMNTLRDPGLGKLAIANPEHAPYGRAAMAAIEHMEIQDRVKTKLVVAENIAQAAQYADSGNAEAGLISLTSALTPRLKADGSYVEVPADSYPPILQGALVIKNARGRAEAHRFLDFLNSTPIRRALAERGLSAP